MNFNLKCTVLITANVGFLAFHLFEDSKVIPVALIMASILCSLVAVFGGQFFIFPLGAMPDKDGKSLVRTQFSFSSLQLLILFLVSFRYNVID